MSVQPPLPFRERFQYVLLAQRLRPFLAIAIVCAALVALVETLMGVDMVLRPLDQGAATHPATAFCLISLGLGLFRYRVFMPTPRLRVAIYCGCLAGLLLLVAVRVFMGGIGIFATTVPETMPSAYMYGYIGTDTALILAFMFAAALLRRRFGSIGIFFALLAGACVINAFIGQSYDVDFIEGHMAVTTLIVMVPASLGVLSLYAHKPFVRVVLLADQIGARTRMMMLVGFLVPWIAGLILVHGYTLPERHVPVESIMIMIIVNSMLAIAVYSGYLQASSDVARRRSERALQFLATSDQLTGTLNRMGITAELEQRWQDFVAEDTHVAIVLIDLDHFKQINDQYGHPAGDRVLASIERLLRPHLRRGDVLGRWGGEEFLLILQDADRESVAVVCDRLRDAIAGYVPRARDVTYRVTASFGVAFFAFTDGTSDHAVKRADKALYVAKAAGRNQVVLDGDDQWDAA